MADTSVVMAKVRSFTKAALWCSALWAGACLLAPAPSWAQAAGSQPKKEAPQSDDEVPKRRSNHFRSLTKVRNGSSLRRTTEPAPAPDLRGEYERRRDLEVVRHFQRLAELDAIAKIANDAGDESTLSKVETVRRAELERFRRSMRVLRTVMQARVEGGLP